MQYEYQNKKHKKLTGPVYKKISLYRWLWTAAMIGGMGLAILFGISLLVLVSVGAVLGGGIFGIQLSQAILLPFFAGSVILGIAGKVKCGLCKRFEEYKQILGQREYGNFSELAEKTGKSIRYIKKDIRKMIGQKWFLQAHIDEEETCLMLTDSVYEDYLELQNRIREQKVVEDSYESPEIKEFMREGSQHIQEIEKACSRIGRTVFTDDVYRLIAVMRQILQRVAEEPEKIGQTRRFMEYYMPITAKLIQAYADLEEQTIESQNIKESKKEIEESMHTLQHAYEELLDQLYEEQSWDVSSDISVLKTMLAQDGLTQKEFKGE